MLNEFLRSILTSLGFLKCPKSKAKLRLDLAVLISLVIDGFVLIDLFLIDETTLLSKIIIWTVLRNLRIPL